MFYILAFFYKKTSASFITLGFLPFIKDHTTYGNTTAEVGTVISSGTVYMDAGNNVNARQVSIYADEGLIAIKAGSNVAAGNNLTLIATGDGTKDADGFANNGDLNGIVSTVQQSNAAAHVSISHGKVTID